MYVYIYNIYTHTYIYIDTKDISLLFMIAACRTVFQVGLSSELKELALTCLAEWAAQLGTSNPKQGNLPATHDLCGWLVIFCVFVFFFFSRGSFCDLSFFGILFFKSY